MNRKIKIPKVEPHYTRLQQKFGAEGKAFYQAIVSRLQKSPQLLIKDTDKLRQQLSKELKVNSYRITQLIEDSVYMFQFLDMDLAERCYLFSEELIKHLENTGKLNNRQTTDLIINAQKLKINTASTITHDFNLKGINFEVREIKNDMYQLRLELFERTKPEKKT